MAKNVTATAGSPPPSPDPASSSTDDPAGSGDPGAGEDPQMQVNRVIGSFGIILNLLVLVIFSRYPKSIGNIPRLFILNQSSIDMMAAIFLLVAQSYGYTVSTQFPEGLSGLKDLYCKCIWTTYLLWAMLSASTTNMMFLTIERYISIVHATWHHTRCTPRRVYFVLVTAWLLGLVEMFYVDAMNGHYVPETDTCVWIGQGAVGDKVIGTYNFIYMYILPISVIIFCYGRIFLALHRRVGDAAGSGHADKKGRLNRNLAKTCAVVALAYIVCFTPNQITWYQFTLGGPLDLTGTWYKFTVVLSFCNCCINPIIYWIRMDACRSGMRNIFFPPKGGDQELTGIGGSSVTIPYKSRPAGGNTDNGVLAEVGGNI